MCQPSFIVGRLLANAARTADTCSADANKAAPLALGSTVRKRLLQYPFIREGSGLTSPLRLLRTLDVLDEQQMAVVVFED